MAGNFLTIDYGDRTTPLGVMAKVRGDIERTVDESRELALEAAALGAETMAEMAPRGQTGELHERITHDDTALWHPGGEGGGGYWETAAGVLDTGDDYPLFVAGGTGEFAGEGLSGLLGIPSKGRIYPSQGNVFPMQIMGLTIFRAWQTGQRPQTDWITAAQQAADELVRMRIDAVASGRP